MKRLIVKGSVICLLLMVGSAQAGWTVDDLVAHVDGGVLSGAPDYDWWYGCSPTSAGMMMGYYDINGYNGLCYDNLVPGGVAELSNYGNPSAIANSAIASNGHIADFWVGYGQSGNDPNPTTTRAFDCLADFMGTSQDSAGNSDGGTTFWFINDGSRTDAAAILGAGYGDRSGSVGLWEYLTYSGYGDGALADQMIYNQYIDTLGLTYGFSWEDYMAEIDAGRGVMIHVDGHSMFGYGYDETTAQQIILHDTWDEGEHRMTWGGSYAGLAQYGVTVFEPTGGTQCNVIPVPGAFVLASIGVALVTRRRKLKAC